MAILHSKIIGTGKPLLVLHGYFGMGDNWKSHALKLSEDGFEVHLIDQRNHGRSFHSEVFNYELLVEDLSGYMQYHAIEKATLLGHSMGGKTVMLFAVRHPEKVEKLVVADIGPKAYPPHHDTILKALNSVDFSIHNTRQLVDDKLAEYISERGVRQFLLKNAYWESKGNLRFRFNLKALTIHNKEVGLALPSFLTFEGDTLFLAGAKSGYITKDDEPLIKAHFPKAELIEIANAGHWLHAENPKDFYKALISFIS